jgi:histidinol-phosphatase (PHP family)
MTAWPRLDYHTHICEATIDVMFARAAELGVREYGVAEHIFQLHEGQPIFPQIPPEGPPCSRDWYVSAVRERGLAHGLDVRLGLEVDFVPGTESQVQAVLDGVEWDFLLGSVHEIDTLDFFENDPTDAAHGESLWERYVALLIEAVRSGKFDVITHPVRNSVRNPHVPAHFDTLADELAHTAAIANVAIELNGEDITCWPVLVRQLATACARHGCPISFGSDAHGPQSIGRGMQSAMDIARSVGVTHAVSFRKRERRLIPLTD